MTTLTNLPCSRTLATTHQGCRQQTQHEDLSRVTWFWSNLELQRAIRIRSEGEPILIARGQPTINRQKHQSRIIAPFLEAFQVEVALPVDSDKD